MKKFFTLIILFLCSCTRSGTDTGQPIVNFKINGSSNLATVVRNDLWQKILGFVMPTAHAGPSTIADSGARPVILSQFWTTMGEIEFKMEETASTEEVDGDSIEFVGPYTTDMLVTNVNPLGSTTLNVSSLRRVKTKLMQTKVLPSGAPSALLNNSIYISGTVNGIAFTFSSSEETEFEVSGPNAISALTGSELLLQLQIANLFKRIDMSSIVSPTDISEGTPVSATNPCPNIDASASNLYTCFRKGLETESNFGADNGDDELDDSDDLVK